MKAQQYGEMVFGSRAMHGVCESINAVADSNTNVFVTGETGVGKELVARAIHQRSGRPGGMHIIHCPSYPHALIEGEFFGHARGSFTGAFCDYEGILSSARGGTILLDEISEVSVGFQAKILRFLETKKIRRLGQKREDDLDVRVITASNQDLGGLIRKGTFREDLYYRLGFPIHIPPLRERPEDIPVLTTYFVDFFSGLYKKQSARNFSDLAPSLVRLPWGGNVRELKTTVESEILKPYSAISPDGFLNRLLRNQPFEGGPCETSVYSKDGKLMTWNEARDRARKVLHNLAVEALKRSSGNIAQAAASLYVGKSTFSNKLTVLGIRPSDYKK